MHTPFQVDENIHFPDVRKTSSHMCTDTKMTLKYCWIYIMLTSQDCLVLVDGFLKSIALHLHADCGVAVFS